MLNGPDRDRRALQVMDLTRLVIFVVIVATAFLAAWQFGAIAAIVALVWLGARWNRRRPTGSLNP